MFLAPGEFVLDTQNAGSFLTLCWRELDSNHRSPFGRHRVASVSQELLEEVAKPRWIAAAIVPAAVCHSGSLCLMALNVLLGWQLLFPNILKRSLAVGPKMFALLLSPYD